eukprot:jgi/Mesvir1/27365/Mv07175-RA.1
MPLLDTVCSVVQGVTFCADLKHLLKRFRTRVISRLKGVQAYFPGQRYYIFQCSRDGPCLPDTVDMQNPAAIEAVMLDDATITLEDALRQQAAKEARAQSAYRDGDEDTVAAVPVLPTFTSRLEYLGKTIRKTTALRILTTSLPGRSSSDRLRRVQTMEKATTRGVVGRSYRSRAVIICRDAVATLVPTANGALFTVPDLIEEQLGYPDTSVAGPMLYLSPERAIAGASDGEGAGHEGEGHSCGRALSNCSLAASMDSCFQYFWSLRFVISWMSFLPNTMQWHTRPGELPDVRRTSAFPYRGLQGEDGDSHNLAAPHNLSLCGFCGQSSSETTCKVTLTSKRGGAQATVACSSFTKFNYASAAKYSKSSPCTNVPRVCGVCPGGNTIVWSYDYLNHLQLKHADRSFTLDEIEKNAITVLECREVLNKYMYLGISFEKVFLPKLKVQVGLLRDTSEVALFWKKVLAICQYVASHVTSLMMTGAYEAYILEFSSSSTTARRCRQRMPFKPSTLRSLFLHSILCACLLQAALGAAASSDGATGNHSGLPVLESASYASSLFGALKRQEEGAAPGSQANTMELGALPQSPDEINEHRRPAEQSVRDTEVEQTQTREGEEQPPLSLEHFLRSITRDPRLTEHKGQVPPGGSRFLVAGSYPSALVAWERVLARPGLRLPFNDVDVFTTSEFRDRGDPIWGNPTVRGTNHCTYMHVNGVMCPINVVLKPFLNLEDSIDTFDVNCVKVGVEVSLHPTLPYYSARWYVAPSFEEFLQTRILEIDMTGLSAPGSQISGNSLVRLIVKSEQLRFEFKLPGPDALTGFDGWRIWSKYYKKLCEQVSLGNQELFNRSFRVEPLGTHGKEYTLRVWDVVCNPPYLVDMLYYGPDGPMVI